MANATERPPALRDVASPVSHTDGSQAPPAIFKNRHYALRTVAVSAIVFVSMAALVTFGMSLGRNTILVPTSNTQPTDTLVVAPQALKLGRVWSSDEDLIWTLPIENRDNRDVSIASFRTSCACTAVKPTSLRIPAGESREVTLQINLRSYANDGNSDSERPIAIEIVPQIVSSHRGFHSWRVEGTMCLPFSITPRVIDFGDDILVGSPRQTSSVVLDCAKTIDNVIVKSVENLATATVRAADRTKSRFILNVQSMDHSAPGPIDGSVLLSGIRSDGYEFPPVRVPVRGTVVHQVRVAPSIVHLGAQALGSLAEEYVTVSSRDGSPFQIVGVFPSVRELRAERLGEPESALKRFLIKQNVTELGHQRSDIEFSVVQGTGEPAKLRLTVMYHGVAAARGNTREPNP
jgi:hypothetical protein